MSAVQIGYQAYNQQALIPSEKYAWGDRTSRLFRYSFNEGYYNNTAYGSTWSGGQISRKNMYKFIRTINNPAARLVELYVGEIYGGSIDMQELQGGAIPIETDNDDIRPALITLYQDSNWQAQKNLYVRFGAMLGDVAVKLVDDRQTSRVYMEVLHPAKIFHIKRDSRGRIEEARIEYDKRAISPKTGNADTVYTYAEEITPDEFRTYRDGKLHAYYEDANGQAVDTWRNEYGFVPLEVVQHHDMGLGWGACVFHHAITKIDEINDAWSLVNDSVRKNVNALMYMSSMPQDFDFSSLERRDQMPIIFGAPNVPPPVSIAPNVDIASASANILNMLAELERDTPELSLHMLRSGGNLTAPGVRAGWSDAINKIVSARSTYDNGLVNLNKMGLAMGAINGYPGYESVRGIGDLDDDRLEHHIAERPVIEDQITEMERLGLLQNLPQNTELARVILETLGIAEQRIDAIIAEQANLPQSSPFGVMPGQPQQAQQPGEPQPAGAFDDDTMLEIENLIGELGVEPAA